MKADYQTEKLNNKWKNKLEDTAGLSFATLQNKDAAWEKLYTRLDKKKQKHIGWYWLAAACILIAIAPFTIHKSVVITKDNMVITGKNSPTAKEKSVNNNDKIATTSISQTKKQLQKNNKRTIDENQTATVDKNQTTTIASADNSIIINDKTIPQAGGISTAPVNKDASFITGISPIQNQKKLKVVHINELGEPIEFSTDVIRKTDLHLFQLKLAQQEIYNASATAVNSDNPTLSFKPKKYSN